MNTKTLEELLLVTALQDELLESGIRTVLAGGAVRDINLGREPKDYDLVVLGEADLNTALSAVNILAHNVEPFGGGASMEGTDKPNLAWVLKARIGSAHVDIIQFASNPATPVEVVETFDATLNMIWMDLHSDTVHKHPRFTEPGGDVEFLPLCDYPLARRNYFIQKFGWLFKWPAITSLCLHPNYEGARC